MDYNNSPFYPINQQQIPQQNNPFENDSNIKSGGFKFTVYKDEERPHRAGDLSVDNDGAPVEPKKRRGRPRKSEQTIDHNAIIRADGDEDPNAPVPTMYTYQETTNMLRGTLAQIDQLAAQVKTELDHVTSNRTLKSKYNIMVGLSGNLGDILGQKISVIKEINNSISKSNEMDYKREKDRKSLEGNLNDDKYLMDMYNAYIQNPNMLTMSQPTGIESTLATPGIIRDTTNVAPQGGIADAGYLNYVTNMSPEQKLMMVEDNPNVKLCLIYDAASNNKIFQWMDMSTGQAIPGLPERDPMFLEDTTIDLRNKIAKNINLNETYPVIVINENVANNY